MSSISANLGRDRDYYIDMVPKFLMASGELSSVLAHTEVTRYLELRLISGSYVYRDGYIYKVPSTEMEAIMSSLFGLFEKRKAQKFFEFIKNYDHAGETAKGLPTYEEHMLNIFIEVWAE